MRVVAFDVDGTLLCNPGIWYRASSMVLRDFRLEVPTRKQYFDLLAGVRDGKFSRIERQLGLPDDPGVKELFRRYCSSMLEDIVLYPDVRRALLRLESVVLGLASITSNIEDQVVPLLRRHDLMGFFGVRIFRAGVKVGALGEVAEQFGVDISEVTMVGDTPADALHARIAGARSVIVRRGHIDPRHFNEGAKPDKFVDSLDELQVPSRQ